jgi:hypothetical protein
MGALPLLLLLVTNVHAQTISQTHPLDEGMRSDPRVLYAESWDRPRGAPPKDWHRRSFYATNRIDAGGKWPIRDGVPWPSQWNMTNLAIAEGVLGNGLRVTMWAQEWGTGSPTYDVRAGSGAEAEHLFYRYYIKFDPRVSFAKVCDGGKLPGFAGRTDLCANSSDGKAVRGGKCGWSLRGGYGINCPREAGHPLVSITTYAYHADMQGTYGDHWRWARIETGKWTCIEGELKVNTPGSRNGVLRGWIDGNQVFEKTDVYLRGDPPYDSRLDGGRLGISKYWGTLHHGGAAGMFEGGPGPNGDTEAYIWLDQTVVATERIGCVTGREKAGTDAIED